jgi:hypothetical protein
MKKIILTMLITITAITAVLAREAGINSRIMNAFNSKFGSVKELSWTKEDKNFKASFLGQQGYMNAIYNE